MFKRIFRFLFLSMVFLSGVIVGGVNTPKVISYAYNLNDTAVIEEQDVQQKIKPQKRAKRIIRTVV